jgi:energy-coupling factor transporter ATP-binding protein EcfA2
MQDHTGQEGDGRSAMTEGQGLTAASARIAGAETPPPAQGPPAAPTPASGVPVPGTSEPGASVPGTSEPGASEPAAPAPDASEPAVPEPGAPAPATAAVGDLAAAEEVAPAEVPHRRVDARQLEAAILSLRHRIVDVTLLFGTDGVDEARAERRKLLSQIDDYLLPRLRQSGAPILVALVGSTGAGKSTLVNSLVGMQISNTGVRRPTTNSPVLACHPDDADWFAENVFLPTVPRVRQEGLARSGRDGLLVLAAVEGMPKGIALLDTPDIDSVVQAHREFAYQFLDASDLWLFMTSASRYADTSVWELLQYARDRGASLGIVLSRVPPSAGAELTKHFGAMLVANGLGDNDRFVINETVITEGRLPPEASGPVRAWLEDTAARGDRRVAVLTQTMAGVLDTFRTRIPALAAETQAQLAIRADLQAGVERAYQAAFAETDEALRNGSLLRGEILARWQDFAGTGDLLRALQSGPAGRQHKRGSPGRAEALKAAVRGGIESLVVSVADRAAEDCIRRWRRHPAGAALLDQLSNGLTDDIWAGSEFAADAGLILGLKLGIAHAGGDAAGGSGDEAPTAASALGRSSPDLGTRSARAVGSWQNHVLHMVQGQNVTKRSIARLISFDNDSLSAVLVIGLLGYDAGDAAVAEGVTAVPQHLLTSLFGAGKLRDISTKARADLHERISLLFDEEMLRFATVINAAGELDEAAAERLHQAADSVEAAR